MVDNCANSEESCSAKEHKLVFFPHSQLRVKFWFLGQKPVLKYRVLVY